MALLTRVCGYAVISVSLLCEKEQDGTWLLRVKGYLTDGWSLLQLSTSILSFLSFILFYTRSDEVVPIVALNSLGLWVQVGTAIATVSSLRSGLFPMAGLTKNWCTLIDAILSSSLQVYGCISANDFQSVVPISSLPLCSSHRKAYFSLAQAYRQRVRPRRCD